MPAERVSRSRRIGHPVCPTAVTDTPCATAALIPGPGVVGPAPPANTGRSWPVTDRGVGPAGGPPGPPREPVVLGPNSLGPRPVRRPAPLAHVHRTGPRGTTSFGHILNT
jgi:hypothetical protein